MVSKERQWGKGDWQDTISIVGVGGRIYSVEKDGTLYSTHAGVGTSEEIGENFRTKLLIANGNLDGDLFAIERNGNLYKIDPKTGDVEELSDDGDWKDTVAGDAVGNKLFTIEKDGTLYCTDLDNFDDDSEELDDGYDTRALWAWGDYIYVLEKSGTLYKVHGETGDYERFGEEGVYADTLAATIHEGVLFAVEDDGALGETSLEDGSYTEHTDVDFSDVTHLFSAGGELYCIEKNGDLSIIEVE